MQALPTDMGAIYDMVQDSRWPWWWIPTAPRCMETGSEEWRVKIGRIPVNKF